MTDEEQIKELYIRYWQYMIDKDADGLNSLQTDDYYLMHMTGVKQSREARMLIISRIILISSTLS